MAPDLLIPEADPSQFLVLSLISLSSDRVAMVEKAVQQSLARTNHPTQRKAVFVYPRTKAFKVSTEELRSQSCVSEVFRFSCIAKLCGWKEFAIFDQQSLRQLEGRVKVGTRTIFSLVQVAYRASLSKQSRAGNKEQDSFIASRRASDEIISNLASKQPKARLEISNSEFLFQDWHFRRGIAIHDPLGPMFSSDFDTTPPQLDRRSITNSALSKAPSLPYEIQNEINGLIEEQVPCLELIERPRAWLWDAKKIHIFLLSQLSNSELARLNEELESEIRDADRGMSYALYEWSHAAPANRRDIFEIWEMIQRGHCPCTEVPFAFMYPDLWRQQRRIGIRKYKPFAPAIYRLVDMKTALESWKHSGWSASAKSSNEKIARMQMLQDQEITELSESGQTEVLTSPYFPFQFDRPLYYEPGYPSCTPALETFFLTREFTQEESEALQADLRRFNEENGDNTHDMPKAFLFIPWEGQTDGTKEDIWQIMKEYFKHYSWSFRGVRDFICIDRQSFLDHTVLLVSAIRRRNEEYRGISYCRIPAKSAHVACLGDRRWGLNGVLRGLEIATREIYERDLSTASESPTRFVENSEGYDSDRA